MPPRQGVAERLEEEVADHALGLGSHDVEWIGTWQIGIEGALVDQEAHLGAVAVCDDQIVVVGHLREGRDGHGDVVLLDPGQGGLTPFEQCVATDGNDDAHLSRRGWRPWPP